MDAAAIDAMEPDARMAYLGNSLYPHVATLAGDSLAGKVTGMLLEMSTAELITMLTDWEALKSAVGNAVAALPADMLDQMGEEMASPVSPANPSPTSIMAPEGSWADRDDEDDEPLPPINQMLEAAERKRSAKTQGGDAMDTDDGFVCEWDAAALPVDPGQLAIFIADRLGEQHVRNMRAAVDVLGAAVALELLYTTERCVFNGGMIVEETGKPRTAGGICTRRASHAPAACFLPPASLPMARCLSLIVP